MNAQEEEGITYWLERWHAQLEHPDEILLAPSLINILDHARIALDGSRAQTIDLGKADWPSPLLQMVQSRTMNKQDRMLRLLNAAYPSEMAGLQGHLSSAHVPRTPALQQLRVCSIPPTLPFLFGALCDTILKRKRLDRARIDAITHLMLRRLLLTFDTHELKKLPLISLAHACAKIVLPAARTLLATDAGLGIEVVREIRAALHPTALADAATAEAIQRFFDSTHRRTAMAQDLEELASTIASMQQTGQGGAADIADALAVQPGTIDAAIVMILERFRGQLLTWIFGAILADDAHEHERGSFSWEAPPLATSGSRIAAILAGQGWPNRAAPHLQEYVARASSKYLAEAAAGGLSLACASRLAAIEASDIDAVRAALVSAFRQEASGEGASAGGAETRACCRRALARVDLHSTMLAILHRIQGDVLAALGSLLADPGQVASLVAALPATEIWQQWSDWCISHEAHGSDLFAILPWHALTSRQVRGCLRAVQRRLLWPASEREVVFAFQGLNVGARIWAIGNVELYDSATYDFGEGRVQLFRLGGAHSTTHARIVSRAVSNAQALLDASRTLHSTLDVLTFASTPATGTFGFNPQLEVAVAFKDRATGTWSAQWQASRGTLREPFAADDRFVRIANNYNALLKWEGVNRHTVAQTHVDAAFFRALNWFRKGYWAAEPADRFLFEWIGFESLFAAHRSKWVVFEAAPRLHITWADLAPAVWSMIDRLRRDRIAELAAIPTIKQRLDRDQSLLGWERDGRVLLQPRNASCVLRRIPKGETTIRPLFAAYSRTLHRSFGRSEKLRHAVSLAREACAFRLRYLYGLRNRMAHEAALPGPETEIYADALEIMYADVLTKIANTSLNLPGQHLIIDDVIQWYQEPFL